MKKAIISALTLLYCAFCFAQNIVEDPYGFISSSSANVAEILRGGISGVRVTSIDGNPVGGTNINIRGVNSLRTDNQPLWIVDGVMLSSDLGENLDAFWQYNEQSYTAPLNPLAFLDPKQIESIEVIKDIYATAIYGSRGANGVVIVKTRKPVKGERNFIFDANAGLSFGYKPGFNHNYFLSFSGEHGSTSYNMSGTFRKTSGTVDRNNSVTGSFKGNFETHANKVVWFGLNALLSVGKISSPYGVTYLGLPSYTLSLRDATLSPGTATEDWVSDYDDDAEDYRAVLGTFVRFNVGRSLYFKLSGGFDMQNNARYIWYGKKTYLGRISPDNQYGGAASNLISYLLSYNGAFEVNFDRYLGVNHHLKAGLLAEIVGNSNKFNTLNGINFIFDELRARSLKVGAFDTRLHKFIRDYNHFGGYVTLGYDYKGIVGLSGVLRADYTPKYLSNELNLYPAGEAFVDIRKAFLPSSAIVTGLRLKGGYGISGREKYVPYELFGNYLSSAWYTPAPGTSTFYDGLDCLRTREAGVSLELALLSDRIRFNAGFYDRETEDAFKMYRMGHPMSNTSTTYVWEGCEKVFDRVSSVRNQGLEFDLGAAIVRRGDWKWDLNFNVAYNTNIVSSSNMEDFNGRAVGNGIYCTCNALNMPVSSLYGYRSDANGNYMDLTGEGRIDDADKEILGSTIPLVSGGLQTTLSYKGLSLCVKMDGAAGHNIANVNNIVRDGKTDYTGLICLSSAYIEKGDYLNLSLVGLNYSIPLKSKTVRELAVRLSARNLATVTSYSGWNPDVNCFGASTLTAGLDYGSYPLCRIIMLGAAIKF